MSRVQRKDKQGRKDPGMRGRRSNTGKEEWDSKLVGEGWGDAQGSGRAEQPTQIIAGSSGREPPPTGNNKRNKIIQLLSDHAFDCFKKEFNSPIKSVTLV